MDITERALTKLSEKTNATQNVIRINIVWENDVHEDIDRPDYTFAFDQIRTNDHVFDYGNFTLIVDQSTMPYIANSTIDYTPKYTHFKLNQSSVAF